MNCLFTVTFQLTQNLSQWLIFCPADDCDKKRKKRKIFLFFCPKTQNRHFNIYIPENVHEYTIITVFSLAHSVKGVRMKEVAQGAFRDLSPYKVECVVHLLSD